MAKTVLNTSIFNSDVDSHINTGTAAANEVLSYTGSDYDWVSNGIGLTDLSITTNSAGTAALSYNNSTGVFSFTPPDLSSYLTGITSETLGSLSNVLISSPSNGQALRYDASNSRWFNSNLPSDYTDSNVDTHLNTSTASTNEVLSWNGSDYDWVSNGIGLTDLSITTASAGTAALSYNNSTGAFTFTPPDLSSYLTGITSENIGSLSDVTISSVAAGEVLRYSGSAWVNSDPVAGRFSIVNSGSGAYVFTGSGTSSDSNPTLYLTRGQTYEFVVNASGHPFYINTSSGTGTSNAYSDGVTNNGAATGTVTLDVQMDAPDTLYYNCQYHSSMAGTIYILDSTVGLSDFSVSTASAGTAALSYSNGVFTFTPPDLSSYLTGITAQSIENLSDVNSMTPTDGQVLTWDNTNSYWYAASPSGGSYGNSSVDSHLNTSTASTNEVLSWDGSDYSWVAQSGGGGSYGDSSVDTHLNTGTASANQVLSWTGSDYDWIAQSGGSGGASVTTSDTAPSSPSSGDLWYDTTTLRLYVYYNDGSSSQWVKANPSGSSGALVQETAPSNPGSGNLWFDPNTLETYVYYNDGDSNQWVQTNPGAAGAGTTVYSTVDDLPLSGVETGAQAFVSSTSRLYLWTGSGWYNIALINTTPSISGASSTYSLAIDGSATTVTITATDPEGLPITYSIASDTSGNIATVSQGTGSNTNVFTITPSTNTANAGTFTLTFRASDGVNIATAASEFSLEFSISNSNYTTALITSVGANNAVNNSFDDASTNNHTITASGNVTQNTFSPYRHGGYSTYFDGTGDRLDVGPDNSFLVGTGSVTMECWCYPTAVGQDAVGDVLMLIWSGTNNAVWLSYTSTKKFNFRIGYQGGSTAMTFDTTNSYELNQWHHVAVVRNSSDNSAKIYVNGVNDGSSTNSTDLTSTYGTDVDIGAQGSGRYFNGYIADARIVKGTAVYTSAFTPPDERLSAITNTSLLTCHLPYIADGSTNSHAITVNGNTRTEPFAPYDYQTYSASTNGGSMYFDGSGDYLSVADDASFTIGSGDFTAECWVYPTASPNQPLIFGQWSNPYSWAIQLSNDGNRNARMIFHDGSYQDTVTSTSVALNAWTHLALVKNGSTATLYVNGVSAGTDTVGTLTDSSSALTLGALASGGQTFKGSIANARLVVGTAIYTSAFTPPTAPLTAITNTSLLLNGTDAGIIDKSQSSQSVTLFSGAKSSTAQSKYLSSSIAFNGTSDWLRVYSNETLEFSNKDFTIEGWMYCTDSSVTNYVLDARTSSTTGVSGIWLMSTRVIRIYNGGLYDSAAISASDLDDQWLHFAVVRNGTTLQWYINGTASGSAHSVNTNSFFNQQGEHWAIGRNNFSASGYFNGYMSDLRFTKGLARYTSNFTPPTEALKG